MCGHTVPLVFGAWCIVITSLVQGGWPPHATLARALRSRGHELESEEPGPIHTEAAKAVATDLGQTEPRAAAPEVRVLRLSLDCIKRSVTTHASHAILLRGSSNPAHGTATGLRRVGGWTKR